MGCFELRGRFSLQGCFGLHGCFEYLVILASGVLMATGAWYDGVKDACVLKQMYCVNNFILGIEFNAFM